MARYSAKKISTMLTECDTAPNPDVAGERLESLVAYLIEKMPGLELYERNGYRLRRDIPFWSLRRVDE